jgi:hypothetical protein
MPKASRLRFKGNATAGLGTVPSTRPGKSPSGDACTVDGTDTGNPQRTGVERAAPKGQHGPDRRGVARRQANGIRGLSVEGMARETEMRGEPMPVLVTLPIRTV